MYIIYLIKLSINFQNQIIQIYIIFNNYLKSQYSHSIIYYQSTYNQHRPSQKYPYSLQFISHVLIFLLYFFLNILNQIIHHITFHIQILSIHKYQNILQFYLLQHAGSALHYFYQKANFLYVTVGSRFCDQFLILTFCVILGCCGSQIQNFNEVKLIKSRIFLELGMGYQSLGYNLSLDFQLKINDFQCRNLTISEKLVSTCNQTLIYLEYYLFYFPIIITSTSSLFLFNFFIYIIIYIQYQFLKYCTKNISHLNNINIFTFYHPINIFLINYYQFSYLKIKLYMDYTIHQIHPIKLTKDLKTPYSKFRQSLLDIHQIQNLDKIYKTSKKKKGIIERRITQNINPIQKNNQQQTLSFDIPSAEKIKKYRKQMQIEKMNKKLKNKIKKKIQKKITMYQSPMHSFIKSIQKKSNKQYNSNYLQALRQSQQQLNYIKKNANRPRLFTHIPYDRINRAYTVSIKNGKPQKFKYQYLQLDECLKTMKQKKQTRKLSLVDDLEIGLNQIYKISFKSNQQLMFSEDFKKTQQRTRSIKQKWDISNSIKNSQIMMKTMDEFYETKFNKKQQYRSIVNTLKFDRPFINKLRQKNYEVIGKKENKIEKYRYAAQKQRQKIAGKAYKFYKQFIDSIVIHMDQQQPLNFTLQLCEWIKQRLTIQNKLQKQDVKQFLKVCDVQNIKIDYLSEISIKKLKDMLKIYDFNL